TTRRRCSGKSTRLWANQERTCSFRSPQTPRPSTDAWEVRVDFPNARSRRLAAASQKKPRRHGEGMQPGAKLNLTTWRVRARKSPARRPKAPLELEAVAPLG